MNQTKRRIVVTGAASGIGRAIALSLARQGHDVAAIDIKAPQGTADEIVQQGGQAVAIAADVTLPPALVSCTAQAAVA